MSLLLGGSAWAVSLDVDGHTVDAERAPAQSTMLLHKDASEPEPTLGVLHIPIEEEGASEVAQSGSDGSPSLGFARVPLPAAAWLFGTAVVGIIAVSRRRPGSQFN